MFKSCHLDYSSARPSQQGFTLFITLIMMVIIALLIVTAAQSYNTEQRISTNEADRKLAFSLAEAALRKGEHKILEFNGKKVTFGANCTGTIGTIGTKETKGLCATPEAVVPVENSHIVEIESAAGHAWERTQDKQLYIDINGYEVKDIRAEHVSKRPRYIIEYIGTNLDHGNMIYRVTAKAWGKNNNTVVILQSYVTDG
ncbi:PilX N-terminal domain-containing pilus assembly protein [Neisseria sp. CCUG17229]|uniref:pilus assembly PilX family protein n=1 Tax=Neisseria sp. CCUG17229 TaxID=3392036 RepID=UPI003A102A63